MGFCTLGSITVNLHLQNSSSLFTFQQLSLQKCYHANFKRGPVLKSEVYRFHYEFEDLNWMHSQHQTNSQGNE